MEYINEIIKELSVMESHKMISRAKSRKVIQHLDACTSDELVQELEDMTITEAVDMLIDIC